MRLFPKPWFRPGRGVGYVTIRGTQHHLGPDEAEAFRLDHELMAMPSEQSAQTNSRFLLVLFDRFLTWCAKHRARKPFLASISPYVWYPVL